MKISYFIYDHIGNPWLGGGGAVREWEINRRLVLKGHEVHVFCGAYKGCPKYYKKEGVHYHFCGIGWNYLLSRLSYNLLARKKWRDLHRSIRFEIIVEETSPFTILSSVKDIKIPIVAVVQNFIGKRLLKKMGLGGYFFFSYENKLPKRYDYYILVSSYIYNKIRQERQDAHLWLLHNGVEDRAFEIQPKEKIPYQLFFLGRIEFYQKGLDLLLKAFDVLSKEIPQLSLLIGGGGKDVKRLENETRKRNNIRFLGRLKEERFDFLAQSELLIMPSRFEGWGITAIEAAAVGTPVVATNIDGLKEAVIDGRTGILVKPEVDSIVEGIRTLLRNRELLEKMQKEGPLYASNFRWDRIAEKQEKIYEECIQDFKKSNS